MAWSSGGTVVSSAPAVGALDSGSVLFADSAGQISEDNANWFYDETNKAVRVGPREATLSPSDSNNPGFFAFGTVAARLVVRQTGSDVEGVVTALSSGISVGSRSNHRVDFISNGLIRGTLNTDGEMLFNPNSAGVIPVVIKGAASQSANLQENQISTGVAQTGVSSGGLFRWIAAGNEQTTVGAAGAASALPANPTKYLKVVDSAGTTLVVPAYAAA